MEEKKNDAWLQGRSALGGREESLEAPQHALHCDLWGPRDGSTTLLVGVLALTRKKNLQKISGFLTPTGPC